MLQQRSEKIHMKAGEKLLLISWARHAPSNVVEYLLDNECIAPLEANEEYSNLHIEVYKK
jgi:hypothetical protein